MSIHLNPQQPSPTNIPEAPKEGFWARYNKLAEKLQEKDDLTSLEYCTRKWIRKNNATPTEEDKASATFQRCMDNVYAHKQLSEFLRRY